MRQQINDAFERSGTIVFAGVEPSNGLQVAINTIFGPFKEHPVNDLKGIIIIYSPPNSCIFEVYTLERYAEGGEPKPENLYRPKIDEENWPKVLCQDFSNMGQVQKGMKSAVFPGLRPHPVEEQPIINFHRVLAEYMGRGAPQKLS